MKAWNYLVIMLAMLIFLAFIGVRIPATEQILNIIGVDVDDTTSELNTVDIGNSSFYNVVLTLLGLATAGSIIVGLLGKTFDWKIVLKTFYTGTVFLFASIGWDMINYAKSLPDGGNWLAAIVATIFIPLTIGFLFSIVEGFTGTE